MLKDMLAPEERKTLLRIQPARVGVDGGVELVLVLAAMALVAWAPNPLTIVVALFVIGARQLRQRRS
jgi:hypothetical protein